VLIKGEQVFINGSGETSRDFCFIENVVQMNILAAVCESPLAVNQIYNVALNERTDLNQLFEMLRSRLAADYLHLLEFRPVYRDFRPGDVMHSQADISKAEQLLGYEPTHTIEQGLDKALGWYQANVEC
jgi:UDP-N-acetylglucosamine 4-epimerase